jgi:hypothetical protein
MNKITSLFRGRDKNNKDPQINTISEIGLPTNVVRGIHVSKNPLTGDIEGLPKKWQDLLKTQITEAEQNENPDAGWWHKFKILFSLSSNLFIFFIQCTFIYINIHLFREC